MDKLIRTVFLLSLMWTAAKVPGAGQVDSGNEAKGVTLTIVFDNDVAVEGLHSGWGFAALLETGDHTVLFDTGNDGPMLLANLAALGKDPSAIGSIVISHAHWDHTGGLRALLDTGVRPEVFVLSAFEDEARSWVPEGLRVTNVEPGQEIAPGIRTTGHVGGEIPEQALFFETDRGTVVLTGCAHPGPLAMAEPARMMGSGTLRAVLGGFHLMQAAASDIQTILTRFRELEIEEAGPTHCSGERTEDAFRADFGASFLELGSGRVLRFETGG